MKTNNLIKMALSLVVCSCLASASMGEDAQEKYDDTMSEWESAESGFSLDVGTWFMMWDQTSDASKSFGSDAILVDYNINNSAATVLTFNGNYKLISTKLEYYSNKATEKDDEVSSVSLGFFAVGLIPNVSVQANYVTSKFKGTIDATQVSTGQTGAGTFETDLNIWEFIVYPYNDYVGLGYRNYSYEVPQDMYIVNNNTGAIVTSGLADIDYDGSFIELVIDNKKQVDKLKNYSGVVYNATVGIGQLDASSDGYGKYLTTSDATFADITLGYSYKHKDDGGFGYGLSGGYRYNKIETTAVKEGDYSMITEFTTEFHGPFVNLLVSY